MQKPGKKNHTAEQSSDEGCTDAFRLPDHPLCSDPHTELWSLPHCSIVGFILNEHKPPRCRPLQQNEHFCSFITSCQIECLLARPL